MHLRPTVFATALRALATTVLAAPHAAALCVTDATTADFAAGTLGGCYAAETTDGEVLQAPTEGAEFGGVALPPGWGSYSWGPFTGGTPNTVTIAGGTVTIEGSAVRTDANYGPGRSLEVVATFGSQSFQHVGFGDIADDDSSGNLTYGGPPFAMFSTGSEGTEVRARLDAGSGESSFSLGPFCANLTCLGETHRYRIDWTPGGGVDFYLDGVFRASLAGPITANMRPAFSDFNPVPSTPAALVVDWARMTPYASPCEYLSRLFDAVATGSDWTTLSPALGLPGGTSVTIETRTGNIEPVDGTWSAFQPLAGMTIQSPNARYLQYRATLATTDTALTPVLEEAEVCVTPCAPTGPETCDGTDNDCNGLIDDGDPGGGAACSTDLLGVCAAGLTQCQSPALVCVQQTPESPETCNGLDDDCDGSTDEGNPGGGGACSTLEPGICALGTLLCQGGSLICDPNNEPTGESCNNLDDDCDGSTDEGNPGGGGACSTGQAGICAAGTEQCLIGSLACVQTSGPSVESCNGLDDNCNGATDEPFVDLGFSCTVGIGQCEQTGVKVCRVDGTGTICNATPGSPSPEACDGDDNDCDGLVDEGNPGSGGACSTGLPGVCGPGTLNCQGGLLVCVQNSQATAEVCNNVDDDCDGAADEGDPGGGATCNTGLPGACAPGVRHCIGGNIVCEPNLAAMPETCNNADDNCNGQVDEGNPGGGGACGTGQPGACDAGTRQCQSGALACVQTTGPTPELCLGAVDEDCDGQSDEIGDCVLCLAGNTISSAIQTKKTKVRLTATPDHDVVQATGTFTLATLYAISPDTEDVSLRVTDGVGYYFQATIPPGNFVRASNNRRFSFTDPTMAFGGVRKAKFSIKSDGVTVKYSVKAQELNAPAFVAGTGSTTIQVGPRCFTDPADTCVLAGVSATCR